MLISIHDCNDNVKIVELTSHSVFGCTFKPFDAIVANNCYCESDLHRFNKTIKYAAKGTVVKLESFITNCYGSYYVFMQEGDPFYIAVKDIMFMPASCLKYE